MSYWHAVTLVSVIAFAIAMWLLCVSGVKHFNKDAHWGKVDSIAWLIVTALAIASTAWVVIL